MFCSKTLPVLVSSQSPTLYFKNWTQSTDTFFYYFTPHLKMINVNVSGLIGLFVMMHVLAPCFCYVNVFGLPDCYTGSLHNYKKKKKCLKRELLISQTLLHLSTAAHWMPDKTWIYGTISSLEYFNYDCLHLCGKRQKPGPQDCFNMCGRETACLLHQHSHPDYIQLFLPSGVVKRWRNGCSSRPSLLTSQPNGLSLCGKS